MGLLLKLFGPGVVELLRVMWVAEGEGGEGNAMEGGEVIEKLGGGENRERKRAPTEGLFTEELFTEGLSTEVGNEGAGGNGGAGENGGTRENGGAGEDAMVGLEREAQATLARLIELYRVRPDVVPEMIVGGTLGEVEAALVRAQAVYHSVKARVLNEVATHSVTPNPTNLHAIPLIAAGGGERRSNTIPATALSPVQKIARGLEER